MTESPDVRRKRLRFRCRHRGTKELDLLLGGFADRELDGMTEAQLARFEALLEVPEPVIFAWLAGRRAPPPDFDHDVMRRLREFRYEPAGRRRRPDPPDAGDLPQV
ncbi:MAG: succinate dehydrogenase assembly factor 2 [Kiloniellaceae bacterium]